MHDQTPQSDLPQSGIGYCLFGAQTLLTRVGELEGQIEGAKKGQDIEYVHKLRVASRRVMAALNIFGECFPKKQLKKWKKSIKNVTVASGAARDADVLIAFMENYSRHENPSTARAMRSITAMQKSRRAIMQSDLVRVLDSIRTSGVLADIYDHCNTITKTDAYKNPKVTNLSTYENAQKHIAKRLDELLALETFVHDQTEVAKHHELRIAAKRLRYTMEIFSTLYRNGFTNEIAVLKQLQDILGEMHDYYVWRQDLTTRRHEIPPEARGALRIFQVYLGKLRKSRYTEFVSLWDKTATQGFFVKIRQKIDTAPSGEIVSEFLGTLTKVALIADIHGNLDALEAVVDDATNSGLEIFLNAGDAVGFGIYPSQVLQILRSPAFVNVIGNVDLEVLDALQHSRPSIAQDGGKELAVKQLSPSDVAYLQSLPKEVRLQIGGRCILVTHGSPDSVDEHLFPDSPEERLMEIAESSSADIIVTGHTHLQMNRRVDGAIFVNPGSVGRPVDGDTRAEYAVLSLNPLSVEFRRVAYDVLSLADAMRKKALPESQVQVLLRAVHLKTIREQESSLANRNIWKGRAAVSKVRHIARKFLPDQSHAEQDRKLALRIFDRTKQLHSLGAQERFWLECAALLHDIGLSLGNKGHHKSSLRLILNDQDLPFTWKERYVIGSIARYHRKAPPKPKHYNLKPLGQTEREKVTVLASVLRVADALDCSHRSIVKKLRVKQFPNHMILECFVTGGHSSEDRSFSKEKNLFERTFKKDLAVVWRTQRLAKHKRLPSGSGILNPEIDHSLAPAIPTYSGNPQ